MDVALVFILASLRPVRDLLPEQLTFFSQDARLDSGGFAFHRAPTAGGGREKDRREPSNFPSNSHDRFQKRAKTAVPTPTVEWNERNESGRILGADIPVCLARMADRNVCPREDYCARGV